VGNNVRLISTHNGIDNLFNTIITDSRAGKNATLFTAWILKRPLQRALSAHLPGHQKAWSPEAETEWLENLLSDTATEEDAREEYYCEPKNGGGVYIARSLRERAARGPLCCALPERLSSTLPEGLRRLDMQEWLETVVQPELDKLPDNLRHCLGEDFARNGDLTVFAPVTVNDDTTRAVPFLVELSNVPFKQQEQALFYICDRLPRRDGIKLDARGTVSIWLSRRRNTTVMKSSRCSSPFHTTGRTCPGSVRHLRITSWCCRSMRTLSLTSVLSSFIAACRVLMMPVPPAPMAASVTAMPPLLSSSASSPVAKTAAVMKSTS
jgi:hypothetical protein